MSTPSPVKLTKKQNIAQTVKFVLFSASAGIIQTVTFTLMNELGHLPYWPSYLTALILSVIFNFTVNRKFTFKAANNIPIAMLKVAGYYAVFTPLSTLWGTALTNFGWNEYLVLFPTMLVNLVTEYLFTRFVVYGKAVNTSASAQKEPTLNQIARYFAIKRKVITPNPTRAAILADLSANVRPGGIVFLGDSITEMFLASEYLPDYRIYNRGICGDTTAGVLNRLDSHVAALHPSKIFLLIGTNDLAHGHDAAYIVGNIQKIVEELQQKLPDTKIYVESILPVNSRLMLSRSNAVIKIINAALQAIRGVTYIDLFPSFTDDTGNLKAEYTNDGLHLGHNGYQILSGILAPYLAETRKD